MYGNWHTTLWCVFAPTRRPNDAWKWLSIHQRRKWKKCPSGPYWSPGYKINDFFFITDNNHSNSPELNTDESMMMRIMEYGSILMAVVAGKGFGSFKSGVYDIENKQVLTLKSRVLACLVLKHMQAFSDCFWREFLILMYYIWLFDKKLIS